MTIYAILFIWEIVYYFGYAMKFVTQEHRCLRKICLLKLTQTKTRLQRILCFIYVKIWKEKIQRLLEEWIMLPDELKILKLGMF